MRGKSERIESIHFAESSGLSWWEAENEVLLPITQLWKGDSSIILMSAWDSSRDSTAKRNLSKDMQRTQVAVTKRKLINKGSTMKSTFKIAFLFSDFSYYHRKLGSVSMQILFGQKVPKNSHCAGQPSAFGGGLTAFFPSVFRCHMCYKLGRCFRSGLPFKISFAIQRQRWCHS